MQHGGGCPWLVGRMGGRGTAAVDCWAWDQLCSTPTHPTSLGAGSFVLGSVGRVVRPGDQPMGRSKTSQTRRSIWYLQMGEARAGWLMGGVEAGRFGGCKARSVWLAILPRWERDTGRCPVWKPVWRPAVVRGSRRAALGWVTPPAARSEIHSRCQRLGDNLPRNPTGVDAVCRADWRLELHPDNQHGEMPPM